MGLILVNLIQWSSLVLVLILVEDGGNVFVSDSVRHSSHRDYFSSANILSSWIWYMISIEVNMSTFIKLHYITLNYEKGLAGWS